MAGPVHDLGRHKPASRPVNEKEPQRLARSHESSPEVAERPAKCLLRHDGIWILPSELYQGGGAGGFTVHSVLGAG